MLKSTPNGDVSAGEVARVLAALRAGIDPGKLTREVAARHPENPRAAGHVMDLALACLWLSEGAPIGDVLTMLECRHRFDLSSAACQVYAVEILGAVERHLQALEGRPNPTPKESEYAVDFATLNWPLSMV
jgi:hypothetical protein